MKLRLRENSIRLRLLQTEVRRLSERGEVSETIVFGAGAAETLTYTLRVRAEAEKISAQISCNRVEISLPQNAAKNWAETNEVGLYAEQTIGEAKRLKIFVEKDFVCVERPADADNKDAFPHPKMQC